MTLLELDDVHAYYGPSHILRGVSFEVNEGEIVSLLGRNGAGKTTTLRSIAGAEPPEVRSGTIRFDESDITDLETEDIVMNGIAVVPEERRLFTKLTVEENLKLSTISQSTWNTVRRKFTLSDSRGTSLEELYDMFPVLEERRDQEAGTLSGGEQQMLSIARTLRLPNVKLLMLDEPSEGLAPQIVDTVMDAIEKIAEEGTTVLLIEQNVQAALNLADRGYVLDMGSIVYEGTAEEIASEEELDQYLTV